MRPRRRLAILSEEVRMRRGLLLLVLAVAALTVSSGSARSVQAGWVFRDLGTSSGLDTKAIGINDRGQVVGNAGEYRTRSFLWEKGRMRSLGSLGSGLSTALAINDRGQVVGGSAIRSGQSHAFLWEQGRMTELGTLAGEVSSTAAAINERGDVIGTSSGSTEPSQRAFLWRNGRMRSLGALPGMRWSRAVAINENGQFIGQSVSADGRSGAPFLWQKGRMTRLGIRGKTCFAQAINDDGQVVVNCSGRAYLWQNGKLVNLGTLPDPDGSRPDSTTWAEAVNDQGQVVGTSRLHAFLWERGTMRDLGAEDGYGGSNTSGLNDLGDVAGNVVGEYKTADDVQWQSKSSAAVWADGTLTDLGVLVPGGGGWATAINNQRWVVGWASTKGGQHAALWTPRAG
jgi:probable HAF family extracellular repeat protein